MMNESGHKESGCAAPLLLCKTEVFVYDKWYFYSHPFPMREDSEDEDGVIKR